MNRWVASCTLAAVLSFGLSVFAQTSAPARTPDELIKNLAAAASKGDVEVFLGAMTERSRKAVQESFANRARFQEAQERFQSALSERFGKGGLNVTATRPELKASLTRLKAMQIIGRKAGPDGSMELRVKSTVETPSGTTVAQEDTLLARQEGGAWKLAGSSLSTEGQDQVMAERLAKQNAALESLTKQVRDGKFKDRDAALSAVAKEMTAPPGERTGGEKQAKSVVKLRPNTARVAYGAKKMPPQKAGQKPAAPADAAATLEHQQSAGPH